MTLYCQSVRENLDFFFVATETGETLKKKNQKNIHKQNKLFLIEVDRCC